MNKKNLDYILEEFVYPLVVMTTFTILFLFAIGAIK